MDGNRPVQLGRNRSGEIMVSRLGHVGIHVRDLEKSKQFYSEVLGLTVTDVDPTLELVFLSARPDVEHHELLLVGGRDAPLDEKMIQQISFNCDTLEDVVAHYNRLIAAGVEIDMVVSHGVAIGVYFYDPDHNRCEVYWTTGLHARQPYLEGVDLTRPVEEIIAMVEESVRLYGEDGYVDTEFAARQSLPTG
jgi:catechol 2,3-dioxygenase-like lactoylglutathione lyase family enzyme